MPIENRNLTPGMKLIGKYHKQTYTAEVIEGENGKLLYRLQDGREFKSPSGAGMAITNHACDGWAFWSMETAQTAAAEPTTESQPEAPAETVAENAQPAEEPATPEPAETEPEATATVAEETATAEKKSKIIYRLPNQKGVPSGSTRWYCKECGESFLQDIGITPKTCPAGHQSS